MALDIYLHASQKDYESDIDFLRLVSLWKKMDNGKYNFESNIKEKLRNSVSIIVSHYPKDEKIPANDFRLLSDVDSTLNEFIKTNPEKFSL